MPSLLNIPENVRIVLGSRSPRRKELLSLLVPEDRIAVVPPEQPDELGFADLDSLMSIEIRLHEIVSQKLVDVTGQFGRQELSRSVVVCADTVVVVPDGKFHQRVLGQPDAEQWPDEVRNWFRDDLLGKSHSVLTLVAVFAANSADTQIVESRVTMSRNCEHWVDAYINTGEPRDKAGGYGLQGLGSLFVDRVEGSSSNVIGLPLRETAEMLRNALAKFSSKE
jgi:septum formation protein